MPDESQPYRAEAVVFHEYPKLIYAWPLIVLGFAFWFFAAPRQVPDPGTHVQVQTAEEGGEPGQIVTGQRMVRVAGEHEALGWAYLVTAFLVILTLSVDVERNFAAFWAVVLFAVWLLGLWLRDVKQVTVFGDIYRFFDSLNVSYDRSFGLAMSIMLAVPYIAMLVWSRLNHRWRFTHNEFEHYAWGRADDSLARGAKRVRTTYPDVLEFLLGLGAGTLIVYSAGGHAELRRIHNVPMLFAVRKRINRILESTQITPGSPAADIIADESSAAEETGGEVGGEKL